MVAVCAVGGAFVAVVDVDVVEVYVMTSVVVVDVADVDVYVMTSVVDVAAADVDVVEVYVMLFGVVSVVVIVFATYTSQQLALSFPLFQTCSYCSWSYY